MGVWPALQDTLAGAAKAITGKASQVLYDLRVNGKITLGQNGVIQTAASGAQVLISSNTSAFIRLFSGAAGESQESTIYTAVTGSGATEQAQLVINGPAMDGTTFGDVLISLISASEDDSSSVAKIHMEAPGDSSQVSEVEIVNMPVKIIHNSFTSNGQPTLTLEQEDVDEDFISFIGTSDTSADRALVDAANFTTPGAIKGWLKVLVIDEQSSSPIVDGDYYIPFYAVPTA